MRRGQKSRVPNRILPGKKSGAKKYHFFMTKLYFHNLKNMFFEIEKIPRESQWEIKNLKFCDFLKNITFWKFVFFIDFS